MNKIICIFILSLFCNCKSYKTFSQTSSCGNSFEIQYDRAQDKYILPKEERDENYLKIYFESNFNDRIKISFNQKQVFYKAVVSNEKKPDDYADMFIFKMDEKNEYIMNIQGEDSKTCLKVPLNKKYRIIYLFYYQNRWIIRFSNKMRIN